MKFVQLVTDEKDLPRRELLEMINQNPRNVLGNLTDEQVIEIQVHVSHIETALYE